LDRDWFAVMIFLLQPHRCFTNTKTPTLPNDYALAPLFYTKVQDIKARVDLGPNHHTARNTIMLPPNADATQRKRAIFFHMAWMQFRDGVQMDQLDSATCEELIKVKL
jgi:hypothetical protein